MLEMVLDRHMLVILMGGAAAVGVVSKILAGASLRRLVRAAGNMGKSSHPLIRLVKARFEHACMVSDRVQNVEVFVEKYLHEYRTAGLKLHTWRRLERAGVWLCLLFGLAGAGAWYGVYGMSDGVLQYAAGGAGAAVLVFLFQLTGDERYQLTVIRNYMVDHLENVCAHRYEKMQAGKVKEEWKAMAPPQEAKAEPARQELEQTIPCPEEGWPLPGVSASQAAPGEVPMEEAAARSGQESWTEPAAGAAVRTEPALQVEAPVRGDLREEPRGDLRKDLQAQSAPADVPVKEAVEPERNRRPAAAASRRREAGRDQEEASREVRIREILEEFLA